MHEAITVEVISTRSPLLEWHCPGCKRKQPFHCSEKFRANSNGKLTDIWLIYRCVSCDTTKNLTIAERVPANRLDPALRAAAETNDATVARRYGRDLGLITANRVRLISEEDWHLKPPQPPILDRDHPTHLTLKFPEPLLARLRGPLAAALEISQRRLKELLAAGRIADPSRRHIDRLRIQDGPNTFLVNPP